MSFGAAFEPALLKEIYQFGEIKYFKDGDIIMYYGKYIRMMPMIVKRMLRLNGCIDKLGL